MPNNNPEPEDLGKLPDQAAAGISPGIQVYTPPGSLQPDAVHSLKVGENVINITVIGGGSVHIIMQDNSSSTQTNTQTVGAGAVVGAMTAGSGTHIVSGSAATHHIEQRPIDVELDKLASLVEQMLKHIPPEQSDVADRAQRGLDTLKKEAASKKPDKNWYDISAKGLLEAAEAVIKIVPKIAEGVKATVTTIGGFFNGSA